MNSAVELKQFPGKGRGLVTTRTIAAGEAVIVEEPLLLTVSQEAKDHACAHCLCWLDSCQGAVGCESCHQVRFCSKLCAEQAAAKPWVHAAATCRAYAALPQLLPLGDLEAQNSLRFLIQAAGLKHAATGAGTAAAAAGKASGYEVLLGLVGEPTEASLAQAALLQPALCRAIGDAGLLSEVEVAALLVKEQLNSYGLLAPLQHQQDPDGGSRTLRGGGLYPAAALVNHECLPNLARFDALDTAVGGHVPLHWPGSRGGSSNGGNGSTLVVLRALHELPAGTELSQSYFPLNWSYQERQQQAQQVYGFTCNCPRCLLEGSPEWQQQQEDDSSSGDWETDDGEAEAAQEMDTDVHHGHTQQQQQQQQQPAGLEQGQQADQQQQQQPLDPAYLSLFLLKYMCPTEGCFGTMAAVQGTDACECSVCGSTRTEAQFLAELE